MLIVDEIRKIWQDINRPFMIFEGHALDINTVLNAPTANLDGIQSGQVVAVIGDFDPVSIATLLNLIDKKCIIVPLTTDTRGDHEYFFAAACVNVVIEGQHLTILPPPAERPPFLENLVRKGESGLILFSTGTTGRPKAILHNLTKFIARFRTPRPTFKTLNFLLFDHIGGINTLLHTLFNKGEVVCPSTRTVDSILSIINDYQVELLPTSPTFLRMLLMSGAVPEQIPDSLKVITYGTERMDEATLTELCRLLPHVDFRQTFGMSELGILRIKSQARDSLWMKIGGEGVETKIVDNVLQIKAENRMEGYLNAASPFDDQGWYNTKDLVETDGEWIKIIGRTSEVISVGGIKFLPSEIERVALMHEDISDAKATGVANPITGQHVELILQLKPGTTMDKSIAKKFLGERLPAHMMPHRIRMGDVPYNHRFKRK